MGGQASLPSPPWSQLPACTSQDKGRHLGRLGGGATEPEQGCGSLPLSLRPGAARRPTLAPGVGLLHPSILLGLGLNPCRVQQPGWSQV